MKVPRIILTAAPVLLLSVTLTPTPGSAMQDTAAPAGTDRSAVALAWQRTALRTVYTEALSPIPTGSLYLGFTSLAARRAVLAANRRDHASAPMAVAAAAHRVLATYFPDSQANLAADLAASRATIPAGPTRWRGARIGRQVASAIIRSRADDGRDDDSIVYQRALGPGVWEPPTTGMLAPWLGFVDLLALEHRVRLDGPNALNSRQYAADFNEVRRVGARHASLENRSASQTRTANFYSSNSMIMYRDALIRRLEAQPLTLARTTRVFAAIDVSTADTMIQCWRAKYHYGFWRPSQAIAGADSDGNDATTAVPGWTPLLDNPPYPDYVSGHACITSAFAAALRQMLGNRVPLVLYSDVTGTYRAYRTLSAIEHDAFLARIWSGLHFRNAMEDGYRLGHVTARRIVGHRLYHHGAAEH